jgi:hypothetical protein
MAAERLSMRKLSEILRLQATGHSQRAIACSLAISHSTVSDYLGRAQLAGVSWPLPPACSEEELYAKLFPPTLPSSVSRPLPDWPTVQAEMKTRKRTGVTLYVSHPDETGVRPPWKLAGDA